MNNCLAQSDLTSWLLDRRESEICLRLDDPNSTREHRCYPYHVNGLSSVDQPL